MQWSAGMRAHVADDVEDSAAADREHLHWTRHYPPHLALGEVAAVSDADVILRRLGECVVIDHRPDAEHQMTPEVCTG